MSAIRIEHLTKSYGATRVVDDVSLTIESGELFFLLGPSGCGKTTLLRSLAGFVEPDSGDIYFGDRRITKVAPKDRGTALVFQNYALWPHMTVSQNVAFGLEVRRTAKAERDRRVAEAIALVRLTGLEQHRPTQLSGGQQQRVALARSLVIQPDVLLLDEPLSNLDARLRAEMREEIRCIHAETGITSIYVTHDQKEALSLADRMAVMHRGRVVQIGGPRELYLRPADRFVANFLGDSNLIEGTIRAVDADRVIVDSTIGVIEGIASGNHGATGSRVLCSIRPESIRLDKPADPANQFTARVDQDLFLGEIRHLHLRTERASVVCYCMEHDRIRVGDDVNCWIDRRHVVVLPPE